MKRDIKTLNRASDFENAQILHKHVLLSCCILYLEKIWRKIDF